MPYFDVSQGNGNAALTYETYDNFKASKSPGTATANLMVSHYDIHFMKAR